MTKIFIVIAGIIFYLDLLGLILGKPLLSVGEVLIVVGILTLMNIKEDNYGS